MKRLLLLGGGGHCKSCIDVVESTQQYEVVGILDVPDKVGSVTLGVPIVGVDDELPMWLERVDEVLITLGQIQSSAKRSAIAELVASSRAPLATVVSPLAYVGRQASVGPGTIVMHGAKVIAGATVEENCIINSNALIEHDAVVGPLCHVSTGAIVNGGAAVGMGSFVGSGAVIFQGVSVGRDSVVGAGQVIRRNLPDGYYPARKRRG